MNTSSIPTTQMEVSQFFTPKGTKPDLPSEIWEQIFDFLSVAQLLRSRAVCQRWRSVVDGSSQLMDKLTLTFPEELTLDDGFQPKMLLSARKVVLETAEIVSVGTWWSDAFGTSLIYLSIDGGTVSLSTLLDMLRQSPNLERFELRLGSVLTDQTNTTANLDFRLEMMKHLDLQTYDDDTLLDAFKQIFPRLNSLSTVSGCTREKLIGFVEAVQGTLESIDLDPVDISALLRIAQLERLRLKQLGFCLYRTQISDVCKQQLVEISRLQNQIERLDFRAHSQGTLGLVPFWSQALHEFIGNWPKLKCLNLYIYPGADETLEPTFLEAAAGLETLKICATYRLIDFSGLKNRALKQLHLGSLRPVGNSLQQYLKHSPDLHSLTLSGVYFNQWPRMRATYPLLSHDWFAPNAFNAAEPGRTLHRLKVLKLCADVGTKTASNLLAVCPWVDQVHLHGKREQLEAMVLLVCVRLKSLRKLTLGHVTASIVFCIVSFCHALEQLKIHNWLELSDEDKERLRSKGIQLLLEEECCFLRPPE